MRRSATTRYTCTDAFMRPCAKRNTSDMNGGKKCTPRNCPRVNNKNRRRESAVKISRAHLEAKREEEFIGNSRQIYSVYCDQGTIRKTLSDERKIISLKISKKLLRKLPDQRDDISFTFFFDKYKLVALNFLRCSKWIDLSV